MSSVFLLAGPFTRRKRIFILLLKRLLNLDGCAYLDNLPRISPREPTVVLVADLPDCPITRYMMKARTTSPVELV